MSDLLVTYKNLTNPPKACGEEPPMPDAKNPNPKDDCYLVVPLLDSDHPKDNPRSVRFDRQGRGFQLSKFNTNENLTWISNHRNLPEVLEILRMTESLMRSVPAIEKSESYQIFLVMTQFIATGRAVFDANEWASSADDSILRTDYEMAIALLGIFAYNSEGGLRQIFGALNVLRGDGITSQAASERIVWMNDLLGLRASLPKAWGHFVKGVGLERTQWSEWTKTASGAQSASLIQILLLCQKMVVDHWQKKNFRFDRPFFLKASEAFEKMVQDPKNNVMVEGNFCHHLEGGLKELWGETKVPSSFRQQCHSALALVPRHPVEAAHESLKEEILGEGGLKKLRILMKEESQRTRMSVDGLQGKGRLEEVLKLYLRSFIIDSKNRPVDFPELTFDASGFAIALGIILKDNRPIQREYILSSLAVLRRLFDEKGNPFPVRIFWNGQFVEMPMKFTRGQAEDILHLRQIVERMLKVSEHRTNKLLPRLEAGICAAGLGGLAASETLTSGDTQYGLGISSAALAGGGCLARVGHEVWPKIFPESKIHRWVWEGGTAFGGGVLGSILYALAKRGSSDPGDPTKFPVDEYGERQQNPGRPDRYPNSTVFTLLRKSI